MFDSVQLLAIREALSVVKDAFLTIVICVTLSKIKHGDAHSIERLLFIVILFSF